MLLASPSKNHSYTALTHTSTLPQHINMNSNSTGPTGIATSTSTNTNGSRHIANSSELPQSPSPPMDENSSSIVNVSQTGISPTGHENEDSGIGSGHMPLSSTIPTNTENGAFNSSGHSLVHNDKKGSNLDSGSTNHNPQNPTPVIRPTRESVLRLLSDALMRRSLTKVCYFAPD